MYEPKAWRFDGKIFFIRRRLPKKVHVLKDLGVKRNSYAGNIISRMYDFYFGEATDFTREYKKYYSKEYDTLSEFIEEHYNIDSDRAALYAEQHYCMKDCFSTIDRNIETLEYDSDFLALFFNAIGGVEHENTNGVYNE